MRYRSLLLEPFSFNSQESGNEALEMESFEYLESEVNRNSPEFIRWVQESLNKILNLRLIVDGRLGPSTRNAIRSFQQKKGLVADGIIGEKTESALKNAFWGKNITSSIPPASTATPRVLTYTTKDVIDNRISVPAQHSLVRLSKNPATSADAVAILQEIKAGRLGGIYCANWEKAAQRAIKLGKTWWTVIPEGEDAILMHDPDDLTGGAPLIAFRRDLDPDCGLLKGEQRFTTTPERIDTALLRTWRTYLSANSPTPFCQLTTAHPIDVPVRGAFSSDFNRIVQQEVQFISDEVVMQNAFHSSRRTLRVARNALAHLIVGFEKEKKGISLTEFQKRVLISVGRWLKADTNSIPASRSMTAEVVRRAIRLFDMNLAVKTSGGQDPALKRTVGNFHARVYGNPDRGVECGDPFFNKDGPNCRRDVITHEFFHFVGVHHGGSSLGGETIRGSITTPEQALDSADNLAQLVSEIMNGKSDACTRPGD